MGERAWFINLAGLGFPILLALYLNLELIAFTVGLSNPFPLRTARKAEKIGSEGFLLPRRGWKEEEEARREFFGALGPCGGGGGRIIYHWRPLVLLLLLLFFERGKILPVFPVSLLPPHPEKNLSRSRLFLHHLKDAE